MQHGVRSLANNHRGGNRRQQPHDLSDDVVYLKVEHAVEDRLRLRLADDVQRPPRILRRLRRPPRSRVRRIYGYCEEVPERYVRR